MNFTIRRAEEIDISEIAKIFRVIRNHDLPYLPHLHTTDEDLEHFKNKVFKEDKLFIAESEGKIVGFIAFNNEWVNHLYVLPKYQNQGLGKEFLSKAKEDSKSLSLWVFQKNTRAKEFYEKNGFVWVKDTDGAKNEEKEPDSLYTWSANE